MVDSKVAYKITTPNTLPIPTFLKCGTADSTKEAKTIEVKTTKARSRKIHRSKTLRRTSTVRIIVLVDMEIGVVISLDDIQIIVPQKTKLYNFNKLKSKHLNKSIFVLKWSDNSQIKFLIYKNLFRQILNLLGCNFAYFFGFFFYVFYFMTQELLSAVKICNIITRLKRKFHVANQTFFCFV